MHADFAEKSVLVTGAAQGIGRSIAQHLGQRGAQLILLDVDAPRLAAAADDLRARGCVVHTLVADLASASACIALRAQVAALVPHLHVLVNNAGIELEASLSQLTAADFDRLIAVNLRAPLLLAQALEPLFPADGGAIVNISSIHAEHAFPNAIPYACSKAGLTALTRNLALELAPRRIRVNAVCPGYIDTPMWDEWLRLSDNASVLAAHVAALHPLGRRGLPADVASAVAFFADDRAAWITGTSLVVDGGLTVRTHP